jgi:Zn-dependent peptidase ImmA (M78 family)
MKFGFIEEQAGLVLERYGCRLGCRVNCPPVPVERIATIHFGFAVGTREFGDGILGELFLESKIILLNSSDPLVRQRFTIAHELGHIQLHTNEMNRKVIVSRKTDAGRLETEANVFAAALLMPRRLVYEYLIKQIDGTGEDLAWLLDVLVQLPNSRLGSINRLLFNMAFRDDNLELGKIGSLLSSIEELARTFEVSRETLAWRLKNLGLLDRLFSKDQHRSKVVY